MNNSDRTPQNDSSRHEPIPREHSSADEIKDIEEGVQQPAQAGFAEGTKKHEAAEKTPPPGEMGPPEGPGS